MYTSYIIQTSLQSTNTEAPGGSVADWLADAGPLGEAHHLSGVSDVLGA